MPVALEWDGKLPGHDGADRAFRLLAAAGPAGTISVSHRSGRDASLWGCEMQARGSAIASLVGVAMIGLVVGCSTTANPPTSALAPALPSVDAAPSTRGASSSPTPSTAIWYGGALTFEPTALEIKATVGGETTASLFLSNDPLSDDPGLVRITSLTVTIDGDGSDAYSVVGPSCGLGRLDSGSGCAITVRFAPLQVGATGPVTIRAVSTAVNGWRTEATATLTGWGLTGSGMSWETRSVLYTTVGGADLATTVDARRRRLHAVVANLEEAWHGDDATLYVRSTETGRHWGQDLLIGGINPSIATSGRNVYIVYEAYQCRGGVGFMRNDDHGRRKAWSGTTCLSTNRDLDSSLRPDIAATGRFIYVASVNDRTHEVSVRLSRDRGRTWMRSRLGRAHDDELDLAGKVAVAASGPLAALAWTDRGTTFARVSVDGGRRWGPAVKIGDGDVLAAAARGGRLALSGPAWVDDRPPWIRVWTAAGGWTSIEMPAAGLVLPTATSGAHVTLGPANSVAVAYDTCAWDEASGVEHGSAWWMTSADGGVTWRDAEPFPGCMTEAPVMWTGVDSAFALVSPVDDDGYALVVRSESLTSPRH